VDKVGSNPFTGPNPTDVELRDMLKSLEKKDKASKGVNFDQFLELMKAQYKKGLGTEEQLRAAFEVFDRGNKGFLVRDELRQVLQSIGDKMSNDEVDELLKMGDRNGDGKISYRDLSRLLTSK
jgi:calmodulin